MSDGSQFAVVLLAVICLGLFCFLLWSKYQAGPGEEMRNRVISEEWGPDWSPTPCERYVDEFPAHDPVDNPHRAWSLRDAMTEPDWKAMSRTDKMGKVHRD